MRTDKETKDQLSHQLKTSTGTHFLDSGFDNGRHWQRNAQRDFEKEAPTVVEFRTWGPKDGDPKLEVNVTHNVYHWLAERVTYDPAMDDLFVRWLSMYERVHGDFGGWMPAAEEFAQRCAQRAERRGQKFGYGIYAEQSEPQWVNTYNGEDLLSQTLQFMTFTVDETEYVMLQIHGGADVRGGYTRPTVYQVTGDELCMYDNARASIYCTGDRNKCGKYWTTDDGCNWYDEGSCGAKYVNLEDRDVAVFEWDGDPEAWYKDAYSFWEDQEEGVVVVDTTEKTALCPHCGSKLTAGS